MEKNLRKYYWFEGKWRILDEMKNAAKHLQARTTKYTPSNI